MARKIAAGTCGLYGDPRKRYTNATIEAIEEVDRKIDGIPRGSRERKALERIFNGHSVSTSVDETGRLVLSAKLREKAGIEGGIFIAAGDTFQI